MPQMKNNIEKIENNRKKNKNKKIRINQHHFPNIKNISKENAQFSILILFYL